MKTKLLTVLFLLLAKIIFAQETTSVILMADSLKQKPIVKIDSLKEVAKGISAVNDTLHKTVNLPSDKINKELLSAENKFQTKVNNIISGANSHIPTSHIKNDSALASVNEKLVSAEQNLQRRLDSIQNVLNAPLQKGESQIEAKLKQATGENINFPGADKIKLPSTGSPDSNLIPETSIPQSSVKLPDSNIDLNPTVEVNLGKETNINQKIPDVENPLKSLNIGKPKELDQVNKITGQLSTLDGKLAEASEYQDDLEKIKTGNASDLEKIPEIAEEEIGKIKQVSDFKSEAGKVSEAQSEYTQLIEKYKDKKLLQAEIKRKAINVANDYLLEKAPAVKQAQQQFSNGKNIFGSVKEKRAFLKKKPNELKEKKFYERLVPALTTQVYNKDKISVDWGVQLGYRFTTRWTAGLGFVYRTSFGDQIENFVSYGGVYGTRSFAEFTLAKGLFIHAEFEYLKVNPNLFKFKTETIQPNIYGSYFGIGKRFNISRKLKGTVQGLYRVEYKGDLPAMNKVNVRLDFEYVMKKKRKVTIK